MRFVFKLILLIVLILPEIACGIRGSNLTEGIICFRNQHYREAFIHLKPLADRNQPDAQYAIGYMYYYGQGVTEDRRAACIWINRAAAQGQPDAIKAIKIIKNKPRIISKDPLDPLIYKPSSY